MQGECSGARERLEQRPRILQIGSVEPFREPAVDLFDVPPRLFSLALLLEQPAQARGGPQLSATSRSVVGRDIKRLAEALFRVVGFGAGAQEEQVAAESK